MDDQEIMAIKESLSTILNDETITKFAETWDSIGLEQRHRVERRETMLQYIRDMLKEMLAEEEALKKRMEDSIDKCLEDLNQLEVELKLENGDKMSQLQSKTLLEKERLLRERVDALNKIKHDRLKRFKRLAEMEVALCNSMDEAPVFGSQYQAQVVPSEGELQEYRQRVEKLESIKDQRQVEFFNTREKAMEIWTELETTPTDTLGVIIFEGNPKKFVFSENNMENLEKYSKKLSASAVEQESHAHTLRESIISLWERLDIPGNFREEYLAEHQGYKTNIIKELQSELDRLNMMKRDNLQRFIEATRVELNSMWDKCMYGKCQKKEFTPAFIDDFTDDALSAHESELDRIRGYYADNADVYSLVEKRENKWNEKLDVEVQLNDPNVLNNRGGKLLTLGKRKTKVDREYVKIEAKVKQTITQWEEDHCRPFLVYDERYLDRMEAQLSDYEQAKENAKQKRQQIKTETTMMEMKFGTKSQTPTKLKRKTNMPTPNEKSSKKTKMGSSVPPSPLVKSTTANNKRPTRHTPRTGKALMSASGAKRVLGDRNTHSSTDTSLVSVASYTDFQSGLNQGLDCCKTARSSTIHKTSSTASLH